MEKYADYSPDCSCYAKQSTPFPFKAAPMCWNEGNCDPGNKGVYIDPRSWEKYKSGGNCGSFCMQLTKIGSVNVGDDSKFDLSNKTRQTCGFSDDKTRTTNRDGCEAAIQSRK